MTSESTGLLYIRLDDHSEEWYSISEKHVEKIIYDEAGFRILFKKDFHTHDLPVRYQSDQAELWINYPECNFKCEQCAIPYETIYTDQKSYPSDIEIIKLPSFCEIPFEPAPISPSTQKFYFHPVSLSGLFLFSLLIDNLVPGTAPCMAALIVFVVLIMMNREKSLQK